MEGQGVGWAYLSIYQRNDFDFQIVKFPDTKNNNQINRDLLNVFVSKLLRMVWVCQEMDSFKIETKKLISSFQLKGCNRKILDYKILKTLTKHLKTFKKYNISLKEF